jgi:hypothetical protein
MYPEFRRVTVRHWPDIVPMHSIALIVFGFAVLSSLCGCISPIARPSGAAESFVTIGGNVISMLRFVSLRRYILRVALNELRSTWRLPPQLHIWTRMRERATAPLRIHPANPMQGDERNAV